MFSFYARKMQPLKQWLHLDFKILYMSAFQGIKLKLTKQTSKYLFAFLLIFMVSSFQKLSAQSDKEDVVYLKNGSVLHGTIIELKIDTSVKIQLADRNIWAFKYSEVSRITKEEPAVSDFKPKKSGFYAVGQFGLSFNDGGAGISLNTSCGHKFQQYLFVGGFAALNTFYSTSICPIGVEVRGDFLKTQVTPYYAGQIGIGFPIALETSYTYSPGLMFHPALGIKFNGKKSAFLIEGGYEYQQISYKSIYPYDPTSGTDTYSKLSLKLGWMF
jgi:hypothetical protein